MSTIRRLYFYALSLISALMVIWGIVNLLQTLLSGRSAGDFGSSLATGLSLTLVAVPIFLLHWFAAQRDARRDVEERTSRVRAVFLYAAQAIPLATALIFQGTYLLSQFLTRLLGVERDAFWFEFSDSPLDAVITMLVNLAAWAFFYNVTRRDWQGPWDHTNLQEARRLHRYIWLLGGLFLSVSAVFNLVRYPFTAADEFLDRRYLLVGALTLALIGFPILLVTWRFIQSSLADRAERHSMLRLVVLYAVCLVGVVGVLSSAGSILTLAIRWIMGEAHTLTSFLQANADQIGFLVPLSMMWWFFNRVLNREVSAVANQPRRAALRRLYYSLLALLGLAVTFGGLLSLSSTLARQLADSADEFVPPLRDMLSGAVSSLLVGLPLWLIPWQLVQREAVRRDESGDHARRSLMRKAYLYLVLFVAVVFGMVFGGQLLYRLFNQLLGAGETNFLAQVVENSLSLLITLVLLGYHWRVLQRDGQAAQLALGSLHQAFPVLVLAGQENDAFAQALVESLRRTAPETPVRVIASTEEALPSEAARAVVLPLNLALQPPAAWKTWIECFAGQRLVAPVPVEGWTWLGQTENNLNDLANETARAIRQMAEGEAVRHAQTFGPWAIFGYLLGGIGALVVLSVLFSIMSSALYR